METKEADLISSIPLFKDLDGEILKILLSIITKKTFDKGETVFNDGDDADGFYIVESGLVKVFKLSNDGKEQILHIIEKGGSFGEAAIFSKEPYPAYAEAIKHSTLIYIGRDRFMTLLKKYPELSLKMLASMSRYLMQFNRMIEELSLKEVSSRLASFILKEMEKARNLKKSNVTEFEIEISKVQLARQLGTVNETLYRTFKKLKERKIIDFKGKKVLVKNLEALQSLAEGNKD